MRAEKLEIDQQLRTFQHSGQGEGRVRPFVHFLLQFFLLAHLTQVFFLSPLNWRTVISEVIVEEAGGGGVKVEEGEEGEGTFIWNQLTIGHTYVGT